MTRAEPAQFVANDDEIRIISDHADCISDGFTFGNGSSMWIGKTDSSPVEAFHGTFKREAGPRARLVK